MYTNFDLGRSKEVLQEFEATKEEGVQPDAVTYASVLLAYQTEKKYSKILPLFKEMKQCNIEPNSLHFACAFVALGEAGKKTEVLQLYELFVKLCKIS